MSRPAHLRGSPANGSHLRAECDRIRRLLKNLSVDAEAALSSFYARRDVVRLLDNTTRQLDTATDLITNELRRAGRRSPPRGSPSRRFRRSPERKGRVAPRRSRSPVVRRSRSRGSRRASRSPLPPNPADFRSAQPEAGIAMRSAAETSHTATPVATSDPSSSSRRGASPLGRRGVSPLGRRDASPLGRRGVSPLSRPGASPLGRRGASPLGRSPVDPRRPVSKNNVWRDGAPRRGSQSVGSFGRDNHRARNPPFVSGSSFESGSPHSINKLVNITDAPDGKTEAKSERKDSEVALAESSDMPAEVFAPKVSADGRKVFSSEEFKRRASLGASSRTVPRRET